MVRTTPSFAAEPEHRSELERLGLGSTESCLAFDRGEVVKAQIPGRDVVRVACSRGWYYLKRVRGKGWREVLHEHAMLLRLREAGLPVPEPVALGASGEEAALVTVGLSTQTTLEDALLHGPLSEERLRVLLERVAALLRELHGLGVNHRDFYAGHIHLDEEDRVYLVDLGRAEARARVPRRRVVKDLAALHFSIPRRVVRSSLRMRFLRAYLGTGVSRRRLYKLARRIERKSRRMRRHSLHKLERGEPNIHVNA
jgi:tRNA A-37 threonylcarbamoyl transferase component Bud32